MDFPSDRICRDTAVALASHGIPIFKCAQDRTPMESGWKDGATTDPELAGAWHDKWPFIIPAVALGKAGLIVIDLDRNHSPGQDGIADFKALAEKRGEPLPTCPMTQTPRKGLHLFFRQPDGEPLGNSRGALPSSIDVRGCGGYVIAPGAVTRDGRKWTPVPGKPSLGEAFFNGEIPVLPDWLAILLRPTREERIRTEPPAEPTDDDRGRAYALKALSEITWELACTLPGSRNERLYKASFRLGTLAARGWLDESEIINQLINAADANHYLREHGSKAAMRTIESGLRDGVEVPHEDLPDREASHEEASVEPEDAEPEVEEPEAEEPASDNAKPEEEPAAEEAKAEESSQRSGSWEEADLSVAEDARGNLPGLPDGVLVEPWQAWLERTSRGAGVSPAHVAMPLLGIIGSLIGIARRIRVLDSWIEPHTLWIAAIGHSGSGKSPGITAVTRGIEAIERDRKDRIAELRRRHETLVESAKAEMKAWKAKVAEAIEAGQAAPPMPAKATDPGPFVRPRIYVSDSTVEKLSVLLSVRPRGILVVADELARIFLNLSRYNAGSDREFWLESWGGRHFVVTRLGRPDVEIEHLLVGLCGGAQPGKLAKALGSDDDGLSARILFSWPADTAYRPLANVTREVEPGFQNALTRIIDLPAGDGEILEPRTLSLTEEARAAFEEFRAFHHAGKASLDGKARDWWCKAESQVIRLAGILTFLDWTAPFLDSGNPGNSGIGEEPRHVEADQVERAIRLWRDYCWPHAQAALRQIGLDDTLADARRVLRWLKATGTRETSREELRTQALGRSLNALQTQKVIDRLAKSGWLRQRIVSTATRPARRWEVNPILFR